MGCSNGCYVTIRKQLTINTGEHMSRKIKPMKYDASIANEVIRYNYEICQNYIPELDLSNLGGSMSRSWFINQVIWHDNGSRSRKPRKSK